jgi:methylmalonyl-CoA mutase
MSKSLFDDFPDTSAAKWLEQIRRDLKGKQPEELYWSPDGELSFSPFVHKDDAPAQISGIPSFGSWNIGESVVVADPRTSNHRILAALNGGVESLLIHCSHDTPWDVLLDGVSLPLIHLGLELSGDPAEGFQQFQRYARQLTVFNDLRISVNTWVDEHPNVRFNYHPFESDHLVDGLTTTLLRILDESQGNPEVLSRYDVSLTIGGNYLIEIARLRACRLLWQNLAEALDFTVPRSFALEAHTAPHQSEDDPYTHMIRSAFMGTAAVLGGADRVYISPALGGTESEAFYRHVARNIHHLLRYESKFTEIPDPVAGSYYLDKLTKELVERTWDQLDQRLKNSGR